MGKSEIVVEYVYFICMKSNQIHLRVSAYICSGQMNGDQSPQPLLPEKVALGLRLGKEKKEAISLYASASS